jgi:signal transduction histidine kinase
VTRRILLVLLAFTATVIVGAGLPLALNAIAHDRSSFTQNAVGTVRTYAAIVQQRLNDVSKHGCDPARTPGGDIRVAGVLLGARQARDGLLILTCNDDPLARQSMPRGDWNDLAARAHEQSRAAGQGQGQVQPLTGTIGSRFVVAISVYQRGSAGPLVGTVILARPTAPLDRAILALWVILGTIAAGAMIGAALLAFGLARWVSRPLKELDAAAGRLADGNLSSRASVGSGPPELRRLGARFNTMAGRLEALVHGSRAVIADVSHQLRTPLAALRLRLDLLSSDTDPDTAHELAGALDELARLSRLVDGLLAVARAENVVPVPVAVDVAEVAAERVAAWHPVADDRGIVLEARDMGRGALGWLGEGHLEQVLDNLIANALEALSSGQQVIVTTTATAAGPRLEVRDNGPGMSAQDRERAFLRFSTSNPNGTGLGLAIVHRLVTSNGGTAGLAETPGGGLTVTLDFPAAAAPGTVNGAQGSTSAPAAIGL